MLASFAGSGSMLLTDIRILAVCCQVSEGGWSDGVGGLRIARGRKRENSVNAKMDALGGETIGKWVSATSLPYVLCKDRSGQMEPACQARGARMDRASASGPALSGNFRSPDLATGTRPAGGELTEGLTNLRIV